MFISYGVYHAYMNEPDEPYSTTVRISSDVLEEIRQFKRVTESIGDTIARITREWQILRTIRQIEHWDREPHKYQIYVSGLNVQEQEVQQ